MSQADRQIRVSGNWALASDGLQWILQRHTGVGAAKQDLRAVSGVAEYGQAALRVNAGSHVGGVRPDEVDPREHGAAAETRNHLDIAIEQAAGDDHAGGDDAHGVGRVVEEGPIACIVPDARDLALRG